MKTALLCATLSFSLAGIAHGQATGLEGSETELGTAHKQIRSVEHASAKDWRIDLEIADKGMRKARITALDTASEFVQSKFTETNYSEQGYIFDKVLLLDETYDPATSDYTALVRVVSRLEDPAFALEETRTTAFDSGDIGTGQRPDWVLLIPMRVDADGEWSLADQSAPWAARWTVPFRDGSTQFIPTMPDADDVDASKSSADFNALASFLAGKYRATDVAFVARLPEGRMAVAYWNETSGELRLGKKGPEIASMGVKESRGALLENFWPVYSGNQVISNGSSDGSNVSDIPYRIVGRLKQDNLGVSGYLQIILPDGETWSSIKRRISEIDRLSVSQTKDRGTSGMVMFSANVRDEAALHELLASNGLVRD